MDPAVYTPTELMPGVSFPVGSPLWWLWFLNAKLERRRTRIMREDAYYEGDHPLAFATPKFKEAFGDLFAEFADNWCEVVVDAAAERLKLEGFTRDGKPWDEGWDVFKANGLKSLHRTAHLEAIKHGEAYAIVEPGEDHARITIEHPGQVYVEIDPGSREAVAGLKKWRDWDGILYATVYLPDAVHRFRSKQPFPLIDGITPVSVDFIPRDDVEMPVVENPYGEVPIVPLLNNPSLLRHGRSDLKKVMPLQNGVNKLVMDMFVASEFAAFPQRVLTGVEVPRYPEGSTDSAGRDISGQPMNEVFISAVSRLLTIENPEARAHAFPAADLSNYVKAIDLMVQHIAAQTRTPPHYLVGTIVNASGDALKAAETGLVSRCRSKIEDFDPSWAKVVQLATGERRTRRSRASGPTRRTAPSPNRRRPESRRASSASRRRPSGQSRLGATPDEVKDWAAKRDAQLAKAAAFALAGGVPPGDNGQGGLDPSKPPPSVTIPTGKGDTRVRLARRELARGRNRAGSPHDGRLSGPPPSPPADDDSRRLCMVGTPRPERPRRQLSRSGSRRRSPWSTVRSARA
jgi:hypothetical protein